MQIFECFSSSVEDAFAMIKRLHLRGQAHPLFDSFTWLHVVAVHLLHQAPQRGATTCALVLGGCCVV